MNHQTIVVPSSEFKQPDSVVCVALGPNSENDIGAFVDIINSDWGSFFPLAQDVMRERLNSGNFFVGAYSDGRPVGILETIAMQLDLSYVGEKDPKEWAKQACSQIPVYDLLTGNGRWKTLPKYPNVLVAVDITVAKDQRGGSVATKVIEFTKEQLLKGVLNFHGIVTYTPDIKALKEWHQRNWAFDTEFVLENARPGYKQPNVNFMCYSTPNYKPKAGQRNMQK